MTQQDLVLYDCKTSYSAQKVRLYIEQMQIPHHTKHIDLRTQQHITSNYRQINPLGQVPALQDFNTAQQTTICGSTDIMLHLNDHYCSEQQKFSPNFRDAIVAFCLAHEALHDPHIRTLSYHRLFMPGNKTPEELARLVHLAKQHPNKKRGAFLEVAIKGKLSPESVIAAKQAILDALNTMEQLLTQADAQKFMFANRYSPADAVATAGIYRFKQLGFEHAIEQHPAVTRYYADMAALSGLPR